MGPQRCSERPSTWRPATSVTLLRREGIVQERQSTAQDLSHEAPPVDRRGWKPLDLRHIDKRGAVLSGKGRWLVAAVLVVACLAVGASVVMAGGKRSDSGLGATAALAGEISGACPVKQVAYATHGNSNLTTSTSYVDLPGATINWTVGGGLATCVLVMFNATTFDPGGNQLYVRAVLDGATIGDPGDNQIDGGTTTPAWGRTHSAQFVFPSVSPGAHTLQIQFRSGTGGDQTTPVHMNRGATFIWSR